MINLNKMYVSKKGAFQYQLLAENEKELFLTIYNVENDKESDYFFIRKKDVLLIDNEIIMFVKKYK
jgi:hypothetical protein